MSHFVEVEIMSAINASVIAEQLEHGADTFYFPADIIIFQIMGNAHSFPSGSFHKSYSGKGII